MSGMSSPVNVCDDVVLRVFFVISSYKAIGALIIVDFFAIFAFEVAGKVHSHLNR